MVDIGGYKLHMIDSGSGGPTVVIDAGLGGNALEWSLVQPEIAKFTRVVAYDRAGYAWSDVSPLERTSENMIKELHTMLQRENIPAPYILVGHSFGGINVRLFANMYPDEVAGIVLVDSSNEKQLEKLSEFMPSPFFFIVVQAGAYLGLFRIPLIQNVFNIKAEKFSSDIQQIYTSQKVAAKHQKAAMQEMSLFKQSFNQLESTGGLLFNKPLTVITAGKSMSEQAPGRFSPEQADQTNKVWSELQADLVTKSSRGKQIIAEHSGHMINCEQPEIIVDAVREMVDELHDAK